ncbi:MAG: sialate O-acetylesterase [Clostridiales bacterium]|nr:sialate O-acetylesterase [Clostridiales bacterium]
MNRAENYSIFQRNKDGYADVVFAGELLKDGRQFIHPCAGAMPEDGLLYRYVSAHAVREDDGMEVTPWTKCKVEGENWSVTFRLPEGGLYRLEARVNLGENDAPEGGSFIKIISHVGVGELFLLAGQSNMSGMSRDTAYDPPCLGVHMYGNDGIWRIAEHPINVSVNTLYPENRETASGSSPALSFGREMQRRLGVPVGLIPAALGGSRMSAWNPDEYGGLTRGMLRRIDATGPVGGLLWYQGCSDAMFEGPKVDTYLPRLRRTIEYWREQLGNIPIVMVQLAGHNEPCDAERGGNWEKDVEFSDMKNRHWAKLKEAQRQAAHTIENTCLVPTNDLGLWDCIHLNAGSNVILGERIAGAMLKLAFGKMGQFAPDVESVTKTADGNVLVKFSSSAPEAIFQEVTRGIHVEDENGLVACVCAKKTADGVLLTPEREFTLPASFHACWRRELPTCIPRALSGLPMLTCYGVPIQE